MLMRYDFESKNHAHVWQRNVQKRKSLTKDELETSLTCRLSTRFISSMLCSLSFGQTFLGGQECPAERWTR